MTREPNQPVQFWLKLLLLVSVLVVLGIAATQLNLQALVQKALQWVNQLGSVGAIAFILLYIVATVLFIPGSLLTLGGGALFGVVLGSVYVFIAAVMGATIAFLIGRYVARDWVAQKIQGNAKFQAIDAAIATEGLKIVLLARLSPVFPFNLLNYALGITQVTLKDYVLGAIGMLPGTVMYVYIGSLAGNLALIGQEQAVDSQTQMLQWVLRIVGLLATIAVTIYITRIAKKALEQSVQL